MSKFKKFMLWIIGSIFGAAAFFAMLIGSDVAAIVGCILFCFCMTLSTQGDDEDVKAKKLK